MTPAERAKKVAERLDIDALHGKWVYRVDKDWVSAKILSALEAETEEVKSRLAAVEGENKRLQKILAHVPSRVAIKAKEDAGYGTAVTTKGGP